LEGIDIATNITACVLLYMAQICIIHLLMTFGTAFICMWYAKALLVQVLIHQFPVVIVLVFVLY